MTSSTRHGWYITGENEPAADRDHYDEFEALFTIKLHHGGMFTDRPGRSYREGKVNYIHCVHRDEFNEYFLSHKILNERLGYDYYSHWFFYYMVPGGSLDRNLYPLHEQCDYMGFLEKTNRHRMVSVYASSTVVNLYIRTRDDERMVERVRQMQRSFAERIDGCS